MFTNVSACIICKNEIRRIGAALDSLAWCRDIVVVDSGSTDGTVDFARGHPSQPRVLHRDWTGYNSQRRWAVEQCAHDWVLMLDADEECSPELACEIQAIDEASLTGVGLFKIPRKNYIAGRYVRCWSPDYQARLAHRERMEWDAQQAPEIRRAKAGFIERKLRRPLLHNRHGEFRMVDLVDGATMEHYADILALALANRGRRPTYAALLLRPAFTFLKYYLMKGAFLDGRFGLVIAYKTTIGVMLKYSVLYAREDLASPAGRR